MTVNGVKPVSGQQQAQPIQLVGVKKETPAEAMQRYLQEQKKKYDAMTPEEQAQADKEAEAAYKKHLEEMEAAGKEKGFFGKIADSFKKDYKDVDSVGSFIDATIKRANRTGASTILGVGAIILGGAYLKGASAAVKTLAAASTLPAAAVMTGCSNPLDEDIDVGFEHKHEIKPRVITNTVEVPVVKHDTTYIDKPYAVHDTIYLEKPIYLPGDTIYEKLPGDTIYIKGDSIPYPVYLKDTIYVKQPADTIKIPVPGPVQHDTIYQTIHTTDTLLMRPDWHSPVNPVIDDMMEELGVKQEGSGEFTESFVTYDEHNNRVVKYILDPQASARDGSTLRYNRTFINWDEENETITPGKNEEKGKADLSISANGGLHILEEGQGLKGMDFERSGNLFMVKNATNNSTSPFEPTPLLKEDGFLQRGDFSNSIKWNWQNGTYGHFTDAVRKKTDAPITE